MAKRESIKVFDLENSYGGGGGGSYFVPGLYRVESSLYVMYDFNGHAKVPAACLRQELQPLNSARENAGEVKTQYWPAGNDVEIRNKGKEIALTENSQQETLWRLSDLCVYLDCLKKAEFDVDALIDDNDITALTGLVAEFGMIKDPKEDLPLRPGAPAPDPKKKNFGPKQIVVVTSVPAAPASKGKAKPGSKKEAPKEQAEAKDFAGAMREYLKSTVLKDKEEEGISVMQARVKLRNWVPKEFPDGDDAKAVMEIYKDEKQLSAVLKPLGWIIDGEDLAYGG